MGIEQQMEFDFSGKEHLIADALEQERIAVAKEHKLDPSAIEKIDGVWTYAGSPLEAVDDLYEGKDHPFVN